MPPRNPARSLMSEETLARRLAFERDQRGWTYEGLAKRMTDVGCPINQSAIYKIEKGQPRRRVTVDELVAMSKVFDIDLGDLLVPVEFVLQDHARSLAENMLEAQDGLILAVGRMVRDVWALRWFMADHDIDYSDFLQALDRARGEQLSSPALPEVRDLLNNLLDTIYNLRPPEVVDHG